MESRTAIKQFCLFVFLSLVFPINLMADGHGKKEASVDMLVGACVACHGSSGNSAGPAIPTIAGMTANYFIGAMLSYKHIDKIEDAEKIVESDQSLEDVFIWKRNPTIMHRIAKGYTLSEIKKMGAYFEKQKFIPASQKYDKSLAKKGDSQHENACDKCHTENGSSNEDDMPIIAGQWSLYTKYKLADFKEGLRTMPKKMKTALKKYHENTDIKDFDDLINFYASQQ
ncbi:MAG: c-type cytochrome [Pseudomonadota bacterium]|nr:c-type cytochrome [Pseudomonadota bacterium]|tara:strand:- start:986 stop:1666 length:681 start_codon:yes stop_codon:yes gene_type:complete